MAPQPATVAATNRRTWKATAAGLEEGAGHGLSAEQAHQVRHPLPSPPPLPAGKGSESPSVVKGAGRAALRLLLLHPDGERGVVPRASRVRFASILTRSVLGLRPALRVRLPVEPLTPFPLQTASRTRIAGRSAAFSGSARPRVTRAALATLAGLLCALAQRMSSVPRLVRGMASRHYPPPPHPWGGLLAIGQETARPACLCLLNGYSFNIYVILRKMQGRMAGDACLRALRASPRRQKEAAQVLRVVEQIGQRAAHRFISQPCPQHSAGQVAGDQAATLERPKCIHVDALDAGNIPTAQGSVTTPTAASSTTKKNAPAGRKPRRGRAARAPGRKVPRRSQPVSIIRWVSARTCRTCCG